MTKLAKCAMMKTDNIDNLVNTTTFLEDSVVGRAQEVKNTARAVQKYNKREDPSMKRTRRNRKRLQAFLLLLSLILLFSSLPLSAAAGVA